jgi:hypothetical protein
MVGGSLRVLRLPPPLKSGRHDITEILLKVAKINQNQSIFSPLRCLLAKIKAAILCNKMKNK